MDFNYGEQPTQNQINIAGTPGRAGARLNLEPFFELRRLLSRTDVCANALGVLLSLIKDGL